MTNTNVGSIEKDVKILNKFCEYENAVVLTDNALEEVQDSIENILAEREQDKKRIQELKEENEVWDRKFCKLQDTYFKLSDNSIPKQVVIDLIENETINISGFECIAVEDLEKVLEGERK